MLIETQGWRLGQGCTLLFSQSVNKEIRLEAWSRQYLVVQSECQQRHRAGGLVKVVPCCSVRVLTETQGWRLGQGCTLLFSQSVNKEIRLEAWSRQYLVVQSEC